MDKRITPERINHLNKDEIFVFGSNRSGYHGGGAARVAMVRFGAVWGEGLGSTGQCYAIDTMSGGVETIRPQIDTFIIYAKEHPELKFFVTRIGCGIAGFTTEELAPLFKNTVEIENIYLPISFWKLIDKE